MAEAEAETTDEEREPVPWVKQQPTTRVLVEPTDLFFTGDFGRDNKQTGMDFGLAVGSAEVVVGSLFENDAREDGTATAESGVRGTDYRIVDTDDQTATIVKGALTTGEEAAPNVYEEADSIDEEEVILWYDGLSGERLARTLDFNGRPFARWTQRDGDPYLVKGLIQVHEDWRGADRDTRSRLKDDGDGPRVARLPLLRELDGPVLIDLSRYQGGRGYEIHIFDADDFEEEFGSLDHDLDEIERNEYGQLEADSELEWEFAEDADETIVENWADDVDADIEGPDDADYFMVLYEDGGGWGNRPEGAAGSSDDFDVETATVEEDDDGFTPRQRQFVDTIISQMEDDEQWHGATPDEAFASKGGVEGLIESNEGAFDTVPDADDVTRVVYREIAWLDEEDLE